MMTEWGDGRRDEYRNMWCQVSGSMSIEYGNVEIYRKIPEHLMRNLDIDQGRMWRRDGKYVVEYRREVIE